ncbi:MAG: helix-turn-helix domain-containing protein [Flavobacteriales bacterium]|nr:helix-turn-helix domain-containing protein [Flavobacteriales bacterium]
MAPEKTIDPTRLASIREEKNITKKFMAESLGMTENGYKYKEDKGTFDLDQLLVFSHVVGMTFSELMHELDPEASHVNESAGEYSRRESFASIKSPFQFQEALFERRAELDALFRTLKTAPKVG